MDNYIFTQKLLYIHVLHSHVGTSFYPKSSMYYYASIGIKFWFYIVHTVVSGNSWTPDGIQSLLNLLCKIFSWNDMWLYWGHDEVLEFKISIIQTIASKTKQFPIQSGLSGVWVCAGKPPLTVFFFRNCNATSVNNIE